MEKETSKERKISDFTTNANDGFGLIRKNPTRKVTKTLRADNKNKKNNKILRTKIKKIKKRTQKRDSNLYDINNFVVQNNSNKINEKKEYINIPIPVFTELEDDYYSLEDNEIKNLELNSDTIQNVKKNLYFN